MQPITGFLASIPGLGYLALTAVVVFLLGLLVRQPVKKSIQGGIKVGMGGLGMIAMTFLAIRFFGAAVAGMIERFGFPLDDLNLIDVGWSNAATVLASPMIWVGILIFVAINVGMILIGATRTLYGDFPAMWRGVWTGMLVWLATDNFLIGLVAMQIFLISDVLIADWNAKRLQTFHEFSTSASFPNSQNAAIIAAPLAWLLAHIPGINSLNLDGKWVKKNLGFFAEPMVLGMITGSVLGLLGGLDIPGILLTGVVSAMMFHVWPMALGVMFDGWAVFNEGMRNILVNWMKGKREVYVAVDTSVLLGHPSVGVSTTLMYPIAFLLAVLVPGVGLFPVISVQIIQWWMAHITAWTKGNIIHNLIICSVVVVLYGWAATSLAAPYTYWVEYYGMMPPEIADAGLQVTNWDGGGDLRIWLIYQLFRLLPF